MMSLSQHQNKLQVEELFEQEPSLKARSKLACRNAKEALFSKKFYIDNPEEEVDDCDVKLSRELYFQPIVTYESIKKILKEPQSKLYGLSWEQCFKETVASVKAQLDREGIVVNILLMTGGASKMGFTRNICIKTFDAVDVCNIDSIKDIPIHKTMFYVDSEPEHCIADGLARVGRWDLRANAFKKEVQNFIGRGEVKEIVRNHIPQLINLITKPISKSCVKIVKVALMQWQKREIKSLDDTEAYIKHFVEEWLKGKPDLVEEWLEGTTAKSIIQEQCQKWLKDKTMLEDLNKRTQPICRKFKIDDSGLNLQANIDPVMQSPSIDLEEIIGDEAFTELTNVIADIISGLLVIGGAIGGIILFLTGHIFWALLMFFFAEYFPNALVEKMKNILEDSREEIKRFLMSNNIRLIPRDWILSNEKINSACLELQPKLEQALSTKMKEDQNIFENVVETVGNALEKALEERAKKAIILIM